MDLRQRYTPIVVPKPVRGREMRSTVIPIDMMNAMRAVSIKGRQEDIAEDNLQNPKEEIYHEGYVNGKLYLVPDSNLQAMRDIVNLKMRRRQSSAIKPQTSLDEPTQYHEFSVKFDTLLEKVDKLTWSSDSESDQVKEDSPSVDKKSVDSKKQEESVISNKDDNNSIATYVREDKELSVSKPSKEDTTVEELNGRESLKQPTKDVTKDDEFAENGMVIPPILDKRIKYKSVKPKRKSTEAKVDYENELTNIEIEKNLPTGSFTSISPFLHHDKYTKPEENVEPDADIFRFLISGHIKQGKKPIFIIHHNYSGPNILEDQIPDFKCHKSEENIDIFISGKFFTENILMQASANSPAILIIKPHKILVDDKSTVQKDKFKNVYNIGPVDVALEGEFMRNKVTLKYTPVLSLEIKKHVDLKERLGAEAIYDQETPTTVLYTKNTYDTPFDRQSTDAEEQKWEKIDGHDGIKKHKHVHYATEKEETKDETDRADLTAELQSKGLLKKIKGNKLYKKLFGNKEVISDNKSDSEISTSSEHLRPQLLKNRREERSLRRKSSIKGRKAKHKKNRRFDAIRQDSIPGIKTSLEMYQAGEEAKSPFITAKKGSTGEDTPFVTEDSGKKKKSSVVKKKKKRDKNQAIVENPILAQMQEFFIT